MSSAGTKTGTADPSGKKGHNNARNAAQRDAPAERVATSQASQAAWNTEKPKPKLGRQRAKRERARRDGVLVACGMYRGPIEYARCVDRTG